ncbi:DUF620 domain-containing protein [Spirillospora sp. NBC_00431]
MNGPPELGLEVLGIEAGTSGTSAVTPVLSLRVGMRRMDGGPVQCVLFTTTVTIASAGLSWARAGATVPSFHGGTELTLTLPCRRSCSWEATLRAGRYGHAEHHPRTLGDGDGDGGGGGVQLELAFDGTVFYTGDDGARTRQTPWRHETTATLPVRAWRHLLDGHDPRGTETVREEEPTA